MGSLSSVARQRRRQLGRAGQAGLEHLRGVGLDHQAAGGPGRRQARLRGGERLVGIPHRGRRLDERAVGLVHRGHERRGRPQAHLLPVGELVAQLVEPAPRELDGERIRLVALGQGRRADDRRAEPLHWPGDEESAALARLAMAGHHPLAELDRQPAGGPVEARDVGPSEVGQPARRVGRGQLKLEHAHATRPHSTTGPQNNSSQNNIGETARPSQGGTVRDGASVSLPPPPPRPTSSHASGLTRLGGRWPRKTGDGVLGRDPGHRGAGRMGGAAQVGQGGRYWGIRRAPGPWPARPRRRPGPPPRFAGPAARRPARPRRPPGPSPC